MAQKKKNKSNRKASKPQSAPISRELLTARSSLQDNIDLYQSIYEDYLQVFVDKGVVFGEPHALAQQEAEVRQRLAEKHAWVRNGGASVVSGGISGACAACAGSGGSETFTISNKCNRNCYFCFNPNQEDYQYHLTHNRDWRGEFDTIQAAGRPMKFIGLTGGEPLLFFDEVMAFLEEAQRRWPGVHIRLYTTGDLLTEPMLLQMIDAGLSEIRFSIKMDDGDAYLDEQLERIAMSARNDIDTMVEMPVIPGTLEQMKDLLVRLDEAGCVGINLLEFCYPQGPWEEFGKRGFKVSNPPFPVLYNYSYAGGFPVEGSQLECLLLVEFALDRDLEINVHYCSLENKHLMDKVAPNQTLYFPDSGYAYDPEDAFLKCAKIFGPYVALDKLAKQLRSQGIKPVNLQTEDCTLCIPLGFAKAAKPLVDAAGCEMGVSYGIQEMREEGVILRELDVKPLEE